MRRALFVLIISAIMLGLFGCAESDSINNSVAVRGGADMELYSHIPSRTYNSGINTLWSAGDAINVFHKVSAVQNYVDDGMFLLSDAENGCFNGKLNADDVLLDRESYDWFACYPYRADLESPKGIGANYIIGSSASSYQTQIGNNRTSHLAGEYMPLVGVVTGVNGGDAPSVVMKNVASMIEFVVRNRSDKAIKVKSIEIALEDYSLVGTFNIDFSQIDKIVCTPCAGEISNSATLQVVNGESIDALSEASFYVAVAPFVALSGSKISFKITVINSKGEEEICLKSQALSSDVSFNSGKKREISLIYDKELSVEIVDVDELPPLVSETSIFSARLMSYNIKNCKGMDGVVDYQRVADVINAARVEAVALQELDSMTTRYPGIDVSKKLADLTGMHATFGAAIDRSGGKYGVAVLTKEKPLSYRRVQLPCSSEPRVLLIVELEKYYFCSTHFSLLADYRTIAAGIVVEECSKLDKPVFVAGDLNATRDQESIQILSESFYVFEKDSAPLTFPSETPTKEIDYISLYKDDSFTHALYQHIVLYAPVQSDHRPIVAEVELFH